MRLEASAISTSWRARVDAALSLLTAGTMRLPAGVRRERTAQLPLPGKEGDVWGIAANSLSAHIAVLDEAGAIIAVNEAWRRFALTEGGESDYLGTNYLEVCEGADDPLARRVADGLRAVATGRVRQFVCEYPCHSTQVERWFVMSATRAEPGSVGRVIVSHDDVSDRKRSQDTVRLQSLLLDQVNVAVHSSDLDRTVTSWNAGAEQLFGWTAEEAIGRRTDELFITPQAPVDPEIRKWIGERPWEGDLVLARKDGSTSRPTFARASWRTCPPTIP